MKRYKIGDFAREFNVANSFLKYYEQQGIIRPNLAESGYRYYNFSESPSLIAGIKYRNLGFSLKETSRMLKDAAMEEIVGDLLGMQAEYRTQVSHNQGLLQYVNFIQEYCSMAAKSSCWLISGDESFYFLPQSVQRDFIQSDQTRACVRAWLGEVPIVGSALRVHMNGDAQPRRDAQENPLYNWGFMGDAAFVEQNLNPAPPVEQVRLERCIKYYCSLPSLSAHQAPTKIYPTMEQEVHHYLAPVQEVLQAHNFQLTGDIYMHYVMRTREVDGLYNHTVLYVPIQ